MYERYIPPASRPIHFSAWIILPLFKGVANELFHRDRLQAFFVCGFQHYKRGTSSLQCLLPAVYAQAPFIPRIQSREVVEGYRSTQVVTLRFCKSEKLLRHYSANGMRARVHRPGVAAAISKKAGEWLIAASDQRFAKYISLWFL